MTGVVSPDKRFDKENVQARRHVLRLDQLAAPDDERRNAVLRPALAPRFERLPRGGA
jgi:hypothetical protein